MPLSRRHFLKASAAIPLLGACATPVLKGSEREGFVHISAEELELIKNPLSRPAYFMQRGLNSGMLEVRGRLFDDDRMLMRSADIKDVRFINCIFDLFQGYDNNLENVIFEDCQFLGAAFVGPQWKNVSLLGCEAEGPFQIGCANGEVSFERCYLHGMTAKEGGGHWSEHFGLATGQGGGAKFIKCKLDNLQTAGARFLMFLDCEIGDLDANSRSQNGVLLIERCRATQGKQDFSGGGNYYSKISIKDSQLNLVDMSSVSSEIVGISNSSLSLEMGGFENYFKNIDIKSTKFHTRGLSCVLSNIHSITLENCSFDGASKGLQLNGKPNPRPPSPGRGPIYWGTVRNLAIRNTTVPKAKLGYMQLGELTLEKSTLADADLSHSTIGTLRFKEVKLDGALDLSNTTIRQVDNQGLSNTAQVTGRLESNPAGPAPDLSRLNKLQPGSNGKR